MRILVWWSLSVLSIIRSLGDSFAIMMHPVYSIFVFSILINLCGAIYQWQFDRQERSPFLYHSVLGPILDGPVFRYARNDENQGAYTQNKNRIRFGWQNPIRVAPTLPPRFNPDINTYPTTRWTTTTEYYRDPLITSGSQQHNQYEKFTPERKPIAQAQVGRKTCSKGSRRDKQNGQCLSLGSTCGENMVFYEDPSDKEYGQCDCIQDTNRPLVYHRESEKCYFIFQQAFCKQSEWLTFDISNNRSTCTVNPCRNWAKQNVDTWNWTNNDRRDLDNFGVVALVNERICTVLGWPCKQEGKGKLANILQNASQQAQTGIVLSFEGPNLVCQRRNGLSEFDGNHANPESNLTLVCRPGLFNKWRQDGRCRV